MIRVRHYTRVSGRDKILADGRIMARGRGRVFFERADRNPLSPVQAESTYQIGPGKGRAYVEFDIDEAAVDVNYNKRIKMDEMSVTGDVDLTNANPIGFNNG